MKALRFDEISVGDRESILVRVSAESLAAFAALSGDVNPLHVDDEFARERGFPGPVAHGLLVASFFSRLVGTMLPGRDCLLQQVRFDFKAPVTAGEALIFSVEVVQKVEAVKALVLDARATGEEGLVRVVGRIQVGFTA